MTVAAFDPSLVDRDPSRRTVIRRIRNIYEATPDELRETASHWYDNVHEAAAKAAVGGHSIKQAAGLVAAVSPNMDWEQRNIRAFDEVSSLSGKQWAAIQRSARAGRGRTDEAKEALHGIGVATATDSNLIKAHRIWNLGEDPDDVMPRSSAPKTNSFMHNIEEPGKAGPVTIDGRQADIHVDSMRPWKWSGRGISSANLKTKASRYEENEEHLRGAADAISRSRGQTVLPHQVQAVTWEMGKQIERGFDPQRSKGDPRLGQSYQGRLNAFLSGQGRA